MELDQVGSPSRGRFGAIGFGQPAGQMLQPGGSLDHAERDRRTRAAHGVGDTSGIVSSFSSIR